MTTQTIPNDGNWHEVPSWHVDAPRTSLVQLEIGEGGMVLARNVSSAPVDIRYDDLADDFDKADERAVSQ